MLQKIAAPDFDLEKTLNSGQVFHWESHGDGFVGTIEDLPVSVRQKKQTLYLEGGETPRHSPVRFGPGSRELAPPSLKELVSNYFALDHQLTDICRSFPDDRVMNAAADYCRGLRIIRQPKWECLATFICSSMKQVAHIRQISHALRKRFGEARQIGGQSLHTFPSAARVAQSSETELQKCGLGYRAKNLLATAQLVSGGQAHTEAWARLPDSELAANLSALPGVGPKVANCVMLFAYERLRAFPIDVWIERVLREQYFAGKRKPTTAKLRAFSADYFGEHGGYAQQYLFHHARTRGGSSNRRETPNPKLQAPEKLQSPRFKRKSA
jgi:N-glycosylase/DNA lyase